MIEPNEEQTTKEEKPLSYNWLDSVKAKGSAWNTGTKFVQLEGVETNTPFELAFSIDTDKEAIKSLQTKEGAWKASKKDLRKLVRDAMKDVQQAIDDLEKIEYLGFDDCEVSEILAINKLVVFRLGQTVDSLEGY